MATNNVFAPNIYQINQRPPIPLASVVPIWLPSGNVSITDCSGAPDATLSNGITLRSCATTVADGTKYYSDMTATQMAALANA